uniref:TSA: Wollemia nobilis Ref_Wollemi_Transcript_28741_1033 transcribed RNA sequence n=1 Tax=Wollemia nobilis TaxID=56998 RepID=A0A0C9S3L7_9CONI
MRPVSLHHSNIFLSLCARFLCIFRMREAYRIWAFTLVFMQPAACFYFRGRKMIDAVPESPEAQQQDNFRAAFSASRPSIDPNLVLILAALLCALFFGLGLNLMIRCTLCVGSLVRFRLGGQRAAAGAERLSVGMPPVASVGGLKKAQVDALPMAVYGAGCHVSECVICLREFADGEKIRVLPKCGHCFHVECIDTWFLSHSLCPICRRRMADVAAERKPRLETNANAPPAVDESTAQRASGSAAVVAAESQPSDSGSRGSDGTDLESGVTAEMQIVT